MKSTINRMDTNQIKSIISSALCCEIPERKQQFLGVFAQDELINQNLFIPGKRRIVVLNNKPSNDPGEHWYMIGVDLRHKNDYHGFVFDSLAMPNIYRKAHDYFMVAHGTPKLNYILRNRAATQQASLDSCGLHVLYGVLTMIKGDHALPKFLATFSDDMLMNDCILLKNFVEFLKCSHNESLLNDMQLSIKETVSYCINKK